MTLVRQDDLFFIMQVMNSSGNGVMDEWHGYVDRETGEVIIGTYLCPIENIPFDENGEIPAEMEDRYLPIPREGSRDSYQDMVDFIDTVTDEKLCDLLSVAIRGKGAFGRFKDVLRRSEYRSQQEAWFVFSERAETARVVEWLASEGLGVST